MAERFYFNLELVRPSDEDSFQAVETLHGRKVKLIVKTNKTLTIHIRNSLS